MDWKQHTIAIVGGDRREQEIARLAAATGADVRGYGLPWPEKGIKDVKQAPDAAAALKGANVALFPIPGMSAAGALFAPSAPAPIVPDRTMLAGMRGPAHIILGWANEDLKAHCKALSIELHEYEWDVELMLLRGPAIAEGMLKVIIENTDITIHKSRVCVVGQGHDRIPGDALHDCTRRTNPCRRAQRGPARSGLHGRSTDPHARRA